MTKRHAWKEMGKSFDRDSQEETLEHPQEPLSDDREDATDPEKARPLIDFKIAALPPCSAKNIRDGKACILQRKPYLKIYFPGHKKPKELPEDVEWGSSDDEWGRSDE